MQGIIRSRSVRVGICRLWYRPADWYLSQWEIKWKNSLEQATTFRLIAPITLHTLLKLSLQKNRQLIISSSGDPNISFSCSRKDFGIRNIQNSIELFYSIWKDDWRIFITSLSVYWTNHGCWSDCRVAVGFCIEQVLPAGDADYTVILRLAQV